MNVQSPVNKCNICRPCTYNYIPLCNLLICAFGNSDNIVTHFNIKHLQFTVSCRFFVALLPYPLPAWHINVPWSFFDRLGISRFDQSTTVLSGFIQWNWHNGLHWAEQRIYPRLCPRAFVIDSSAGLKAILDLGPSKNK